MILFVVFLSKLREHETYYRIANIILHVLLILYILIYTRKWEVCAITYDTFTLVFMSTIISYDTECSVIQQSTICIREQLELTKDNGYLILYIYMCLCIYL